MDLYWHHVSEEEYGNTPSCEIPCLIKRDNDSFFATLGCDDYGEYWKEIYFGCVLGRIDNNDKRVTSEEIVRYLDECDKHNERRFL